jgi:hypothetical protein
MLCGRSDERVFESEKKCPRVRAFEKTAGPEFEGSTRSGCCHGWQPLQVSRLPALLILVENINPMSTTL